ncbi:hypothetical protein [Nonomuraea basaltis]|uniref:hypothetical protein n=1 Tax=Nonomuraea basaltis TaxID=2495887 RepID=UPI0014864140|nr:hypothetical protein [Nonomuraea basaltis]TMR95452.1 hypothetical protein EJK15_28510 [Nonomuraea basaltis]
MTRSRSDRGGAAGSRRTALAPYYARDAGIPAERRGTWHVLEDTMTLAGPREKGPVPALRRIFMHSSTCGKRA